MRRSVLVLIVAVRATAQDIDTIVFPDQRKPFTFLDQIDDAAERKAFLRLYDRQSAGERRRLAESFLKEFPRSWLLAYAYEIAAKASMDVGDSGAALHYGGQSLRLFPENPLMLVPLAQTQLKQGLLKEAAGTSRDALDCLRRFGRPSTIAQAEWPALSRQLEASARYVSGRVTLTAALEEGARNREELLARAIDELERARGLDAESQDAAFLAGLAHLSAGHAREAAAAFSDAARLPGPLQAKAVEHWKRLPKGSAAKPQQGAAPAARFDRTYAGSAACRSCHPGQHASWRQTGMGRMFQPYRPENVIGDFDTHPSLEGARVWTEKGRHLFATRSPGGQWLPFPVDYTIGSKWQQGYATRRPDGRIHVFPLQYNRLEKAWVNYWRAIDPPHSRRADIGRFHEFSPATDYMVNCAPCHTSQLSGSRPEELEFRESGINCEMCHGPSARHAAAMTAGKPLAEPKRPIDPPVEFRRIESEDYVAICAQCHMQSAMREPGPRGEMNYAAGGETFFARYPSRPFVEFSRRGFYKDGRFRETTFIVEAFLRTACFKTGKANCGHCHDPHPGDAAANPVSLKHRDNPDRMCLQCHQKYAGSLAAHTRHPAGAEASRCVACHMPRIMNSVLFTARTHQIDDIPRAENTERFGQQESPNACLACHSDRSVAWVAERLRTW